MAAPPGYALLQVAHTAEGRLLIPRQFTEVWLDVGTSNHGALVDSDTPPPHVFVIAFEPLLDKYAAMLARHSTPLGLQPNAVPLGYFHPQGIILPVALSSTDGNATFHVSSLDGCSSLLPHNSAGAGGHAGYREHARTSCLQFREARTVPTASLRTVLTQWLPPHVVPTRLKVDAQGMDLAVVESAGEAAAVLRRVDLESYPSDCEPLYTGQPLCSEIVRRMRAIGFHVAGGLPRRAGQLDCTRAGVRGGGCATQNIRFARAAPAAPASEPRARASRPPPAAEARRAPHGRRAGAREARRDEPPRPPRLLPSHADFAADAARCALGEGAMAGFLAAAAASRRAAAHCQLVLYSVAFGALRALHPPPALSEGCALVFVPRGALATHGDSLDGWRLIGVDAPMVWREAYTRRNSRIPKLLPELFFPSTVRATVYIDAKLKLSPATSLHSLVQPALFACGASFAAFAHAQRHSTPLREFAAVMARGSNATAEPAALLQQRERYLADESFARAEAAGLNMMIDGSILIRDTASSTPAAAAARRLGCAWMHAYVEGSDRDQLAFSYALWKYVRAPCLESRPTHDASGCGVGCGDGFLHLMKRNPLSPDPKWASNVSVCALSARMVHGRRQRCHQPLLEH